MTAPSAVTSARIPESLAIKVQRPSTVRPEPVEGLLFTLEQDRASTSSARTVLNCSCRSKVMRMGNRYGQCVGGVRSGDFCAAKQARDHRVDLRLLGIADADDRFLDQPRGIFANFQASARADHDHNAAGLAELERRLWVRVDE